MYALTSIFLPFSLFLELGLRLGLLLNSLMCFNVYFSDSLLYFNCSFWIILLKKNHQLVF